MVNPVWKVFLDLWDATQKYESEKCHICTDEIFVKTGQLGHYKWNLCQICYDKGWFLVKAEDDKLTYMNLKINLETEEIKIVDLLRQ